MFLHIIWEGTGERKLQDIMHGVCVGQRHCVRINPLRFFHGSKCPFSECFYPLLLLLECAYSTIILRACVVSAPDVYTTECTSRRLL